MKPMPFKYQLRLMTFVPLLIAILIFALFYITQLNRDFIALFGFLLVVCCHELIAKKIYLPIARLRRSMRQILRNEFETEIKHQTSGEIGLLEAGCLHLQTQYLALQKDLNQQIELSTTDLQQSLELLEEKNIQLSIEKKRVDERNLQQAEFIANMSHEIRTPMSGIIGFSNLLLESNLNPLQLDYVKTIKSSANNLLAIINDMLDYSKMESGKLSLDCIPLNIRHCIDEVIAQVTPDAHKKEIDLIPITGLNVPKTVLGDPLRIKQMLTYLISNAIRFTEAGYILVRTELEKENSKEYVFRLAVSDTRTGTPPANQNLLFNVDSTKSTFPHSHYDESSLGLMVASKLAEYMQGRIQLHSEPYKGSTFSATIKLQKLAAYEFEKRQTHRFAALKIICYDDNPLHLEALCNGLRFWGIQCIEVDDFKNLASTFATHHDSDLAFINVNQGCEYQVATVTRKQSLPCVLMSKWIIEDYESLGAQGFVFKPPNMQKLQQTIETLFHQAKYTKNIAHQLNHLGAQLKAIGARILIAEDNPVNRMLFKSLLIDYVDVTLANDGEKAFEYCKTQRFHAILLDLQMPKMNGLEAATRIRHETGMNKQTPMMLITASSNDLSVEQLQHAGIRCCLQKPIQQEALLTKLWELIEQHQQTAIDWPLCVTRVSGNQSLALEYLACFVEELKKNEAEFVALYTIGDISALEKATHKLHGACCFTGVPTLQQQVARLEAQAKNATQKEEITELYTCMMDCLRQVLIEYERAYTHST